MTLPALSLVYSPSLQDGLLLMYQGRRPIYAQNAAEFMELYGGRGENFAECHGETLATYARPTGEENLESCGAKSTQGKRIR